MTRKSITEAIASAILLAGPVVTYTEAVLYTPDNGYRNAGQAGVWCQSAAGLDACTDDTVVRRFSVGARRSGRNQL